MKQSFCWFRTGEEISPREKPAPPLRKRVQNLVRLLVTSRKVTDVTTDLLVGEWPVRAIPTPSRVAFRSPARCNTFPVEQFWGGLFGRPVILWIRGASYLWRSLWQSFVGRWSLVVRGLRVESI